mmetsp:Transcript_28149/g.53249  ORF Transcript_28149/g.53249 Transcript_28149/m.53249 type:complete len:574 (-) Transcript_28149:362-2083(-)|eukprot:CAMPEP_0114312850 /NCGR_PEP_ID=MMETSP0059-20121206/20722_1 /TAXON_ID=36894 /ORGANISM="Pyramimonas parkeae, Strain CCMP726" /LENGTH=573 /DNA_ID=CAMNT_0001437407 /DNA_START=14 /DNA_END=1735 /DNA_ORIENTATION=-
MALAAERAKYGLPAEFKVTREMKRTFTPAEKSMHKTAYEIGGSKRANEVMRVYFAKKKAAAAREAAGGAAPSEAGSNNGGKAEESVPEAAAGFSASTRASNPPPAPKPKAPAPAIETTEVALGESNPSGHLMYSGSVDWDNLGKKAADAETCLWNFHRLMEGTRVRFVASGAGACHAVCVDDGGKLYAWGRNDAGQLGLGDLNSRAVPQEVAGLNGFKIRHASCGRRHTLVCTEEGAMFSWGSHKAGQLGTGVKVNDGSAVPVKVAATSGSSRVTRVACGAEFCMAVNEEGFVAAWGHPMYGQLGNRSNGEYIERAGSTSYHYETVPNVVKFDGVPLSESPNVVDVVCGNNHTVAMTSEGAVFTWGFAGYGRLGHNSQKDLMSPLELDVFSVSKSRNPRMGAKMITAGATCSYALSAGGQMFFWGRTKASGEATMYPKPLHDLNGWSIRSFSCGNNSSFVIADDAVITWGPSPTYGELAYGDPKCNNPKSSTIPKLVDSMQGAHAHMVAAGYGFAVLIVDDSDKSKEVTEKHALFEPAETVILNSNAPEEPVKGAKKRSAEKKETPSAKKGKK